jgi:hypothetical protein
VTSGQSGATSGQRMKYLDGLDLVSIPDDGPLGWIVVAIIASVVVLVFVTVVLPILAIVLDAAVVVAVAIIGVSLRVLFRRPWRVSARNGRVERSWGVVGWKRSHRAIDAVADSLASGNAIETVDPTRALGARKS